MDRSDRLRRWSDLPIRTRATTGAVAVVGLALIGAVVAVTFTTRQAAEDQVKDSATLRAQDFVALLESGTVPGELNIRLEEDVFVQIADSSGTVVAASPSVAGHPLVARVGDGESRTVDGLPDEDDDDFLVVGSIAELPGDDMLVVVGRNLDSVHESTQFLIRVFTVAVPVLLLVVGLTTWSMVGRALAPVEEIRREVAEISSSELHRRVLDPRGDDEIARLARTMNDMLRRLSGAQQKEQRLVSDASHELRNPIAAIRQHAENALAHPEQTTVASLADEILTEDLRLQRIAEDLLLLARADEDGLALVHRSVDLDDLLLDEAKRVKQTTALRIDTTGVSGARASGDAVHLHRLVRNLVENAVRHAASVVALAVEETDGWVVMTVDDDGPGIPTEHRRTIFERFSRLDQARARDRGGAGLGLAIVATIARAHGGSVTVEEAPLGGARFQVVLPQKQS